MKTASQIGPPLDNPHILYNVLSERVFVRYNNTHYCIRSIIQKTNTRNGPNIERKLYYISVFIRRKIPADKLPHTKPCTLKMRTAGFYKALARMYQTIRDHIPEEPPCVKISNLAKTYHCLHSGV
jgi:hypothetical protein